MYVDFRVCFDQSLIHYAVTQGRCHFLVFLRAAVKPWFAVPLAVSSCPAVFTAVIVAFCLIFEHVVLIVHVLMLF